jgi:hypothetical protein
MPMSADAILLIESDAERIKQMQAVLAFVDGSELIACSPSEWPEQIDSDTLKAVVLGTTQPEKLLAKVDAHLQQERRELVFPTVSSG